MAAAHGSRRPGRGSSRGDVGAAHRVVNWADRPRPRPVPASAPRATPRAALPPAPPATPHARGRWRVRTAIVGAWAAYGAANVLLYEASGTAPGTSLGWSVPVMLAVATFWVAATPVVGSITRRLARPGVGRARRVAFHAVAALALALASIAVRWLVLGLVGDFARPVTFATLVSRTLDVHLCMYALLAALTSASEADRDYVARTRRALALEGQLARARLDHLQRQLQPHFLFNALNAVAELTREAPGQAARMLRQLARLFRAATGHLAGAEVPLADELAVLDAYVDVQRTRTGGGLRVTYAVDPAARDALVPPFVLQPLVENAIRHGLAARAGRGRVAVTAAAAGGRLLLRVADASDTLAFRLTLFCDWVVTAARGHWRARFTTRSRAGWIELLERHGFSVRAQPMSDGTPFANHLLVATRLPR